MSARTMFLMLRFWAGKISNAMGVPGVVQPGTYEAGIGAASVRIAVGPLFTVVTVNGIDVYIHRFTGEIDGVGWSRATMPQESADVLESTLPQTHVSG